MTHTQSRLDAIDKAIERLTAPTQWPGEEEPEKIAPVQGYSAGIPWSMHLRAYDAYCKEYGPQQAMIDLEGRNCRGGFGVGELDIFIPGWREELSELTRLKSEIASLRAILALRGPVSGEADDEIWKDGAVIPDVKKGHEAEFIVPIRVLTPQAARASFPPCLRKTIGLARPLRLR